MLYILGSDTGKEGIEFILQDDDAKVMLIQDGVYLDLNLLVKKEIFAIKNDVEKRGMDNIIPSWVKRISYQEALSLIIENPVISFI